MTDDIDPATLPDDTRDGEVDPGTIDEDEEVDGADTPEATGDIADKPINEDKEDED